MFRLSRRQLLKHATGAAALVANARNSNAESFPSRLIRLVVPYTAGAAGDQIGRPWAETIASSLGAVYVENLGGASGAVGTAAVAQSMPDGHSLLLGNTSTQIMIPLTVARPAYDPMRDFRAIYRLITSTLAFAIHPSLPVNDLKELAAYVNAHPSRISYGTPGVGTGNHLVGELFKQELGVADFVHVPYRGMSSAINDLIGDQIQVVIAVVSGQLLQMGQSGMLRLLAVTSESRLSVAPEIPTVAECGAPNLRYAGWFGLFAPKATPDTIVNRIAAATQAAMATTDLQKTYQAQGLEPDTDSSPVKFQRLVEEELVRLKPIIAAVGMKND